MLDRLHIRQKAVDQHYIAAARAYEAERSGRHARSWQILIWNVTYLCGTNREKIARVHEYKQRAVDDATKRTVPNAQANGMRVPSLRAEIGR